MTELPKELTQHLALSGAPLLARLDLPDFESLRPCWSIRAFPNGRFLLVAPGAYRPGARGDRTDRAFLEHRMDEDHIAKVSVAPFFDAVDIHLRVTEPIGVTVDYWVRGVTFDLDGALFAESRTQEMVWGSQTWSALSVTATKPRPF